LRPMLPWPVVALQLVLLVVASLPLHCLAEKA